MESVFRCRKCGEEINDEQINSAMQYAHDCGFDEGYEAASMEFENRDYRLECEVYILDDGSYQCGNCGAVMENEPTVCAECSSVVIGIVEEGE